MFTALLKAFGQLSDPKLRRVIRLGVIGAVACYVALVALVWTALTQISFFEQGWAETGSDIAIGLTALVLPILFFPALATAIMSALLDDVADAVEARHYPQLNWPRPQKWSEVLLTTLRFLAVMVLVNLLALPVYAILLFTGLTVGLVLTVNGYLLGREYFELVAFRRMDPKEARLYFRHHLGRLWLAGAVIAFLFSVPLLNLLAPVIGTAFMVHLFQSLRRQTDSV
ncbi:MAG: EI24 domain-containing protein [Rhodospirillaceae bacterium]|nr:EI24 domain-containing protein [Rhodospirillales bacterium]